jgi:hypothetical protein
MFDQKKKTTILSLIHFSLIKTLDPDPDSLEMPDPDSLNPNSQHRRAPNTQHNANFFVF